HTAKHRKVGVTSTNGDLKGFIDQNQSPTKGNISIIALPVSSTNSPTKILPKTLGPINVNVGPQMVSFATAVMLTWLTRCVTAHLCNMET
uniref:Uncharacterized protein n=1 Tax=Cairina moschata TaxID=8855 RepID=A0A8C3BIT1_CAIMO